MTAPNPEHLKINHLANLPDNLTITNIVKHDNCDELFVSFQPSQIRICPQCGSNNCVIKDSGRKQTVRHTANAQRGTIITFRKKRLYCKDCHTSFFDNPKWLHPSLHITNELMLTICLDLTQMLSITAIARINRVTPAIVSSVLDSISWQHPSHLPETLCIDEFKGSSGTWQPSLKRWDVNYYHCNIADGDAGVIIDILPQIDCRYLAKFFRQYAPEQRSRVKYFCCDMHNGFISVAKTLFPQAHICIDMFHVVKLINSTVDAIRRRLQHEMSDSNNESQYRLLKNSSRSLLINELKQTTPIDNRRLEKLKAIFTFFPELAEAYDALQNFHSINAEPNFLCQKACLSNWLKLYSESEIPEIETMAKSIRHWRGYIQNTWQYHRSNGTCEGLNNKIKVLKRISFGLHCFDTFRKRTLLTCGYLRLANDPFTIFNEKRSGPGIKL